MRLESQQITFGPQHHFFGYIGHCRTTPWSGDGRYIVCLETGFQDRMPTAADAAGVLLLDTRDGYRPTRIAETRGWNPQQGTMFYWNPARPDRELFFNDRESASGEVFTVLFDIVEKRRIREYRFPGSPVANGGVAQGGGKFAALNYGRLARLRPVTGYPEALDWSADQPIPDNDGVFIVDVETGERQLICSCRRMVKALGLPDDGLMIFLNHTLWNREDDLIAFYVRSGPMWHGIPGVNLNEMFTMRPDGGALTHHGRVGGHPEWDAGGQIIAEGEGLRLYDVASKQYVGRVGDPAIFTDPKGDKALSPDGQWLVHANCIKSGDQQHHQYVLYRRSDGAYVTSPLFSRGQYVSGDLRLDPAPCWNRDGTQVLLPAIADDGTRQLFVLTRRD